MRKRNHVIPVRLNAKELRYLDTQVQASGLPREEYLRTLIMGAEIRARPCTHRICCGRSQGCAITPISWLMWPMPPGRPDRRAWRRCSGSAKRSGGM